MDVHAAVPSGRRACGHPRGSPEQWKRRSLGARRARETRRERQGREGRNGETRERRSHTRHEGAEHGSGAEIGESGDRGEGRGSACRGEQGGRTRREGFEGASCGRSASTHRCMIEISGRAGRDARDGAVGQDERCRSSRAVEDGGAVRAGRAAGARRKQANGNRCGTARRVARGRNTGRRRAARGHGPRTQRGVDAGWARGVGVERPVRVTMPDHAHRNRRALARRRSDADGGDGGSRDRGARNARSAREERSHEQRPNGIPEVHDESIGCAMRFPVTRHVAQRSTPCARTGGPFRAASFESNAGWIRSRSALHAMANSRVRPASPHSRGRCRVADR